MIGPRCLCLLLLVIRALCLGIDAGIAAGAEPGPAPAPDVQYTVYSNGPHAVYPHLMERSVGSGHMALSSRSDYRRHLQMCRRDLGPRYVRGHGLFNDDMSVSYARGAYSFYNVDGFVEFVLGLGMRPILELSFMPSWMARGPGPRGPGLSRGEAHAKAWQRGRGRLASYPSNFHPPARFEDWGALVEALARHLVGRFGVATVAEFYFEVWNEPDNFFWNGTQAEYFELYQVSAAALKKVSPALRVGGPATDGPAVWLADFIQFCRRTGTPFDFVSSHLYTAYSAAGLGNVSAVAEGVRQGREAIGDERVPWLITEFGASCAQGFGQRYDIAFAYHDLPDQAAFLVAVADATKASNVAVLSYWAFSDVFEEYFFPVSNVSFHGAFGLVNLNDVPKPSYRALQLLREAGDVLMRYAVANRSAAGGAGRGDTCRTTAGVIPTRASGTGDVLLLLYNHATYGTAITDCRVRATIRDVDARRNGVACATLRRIDADHANPLRLWEVMGAPNYTTALQDQQLRQSSEMIPVPIRGTVSASPQGLDAAFELTLPAHGVAAITVPHQCE